MSFALRSFVALATVLAFAAPASAQDATTDRAEVPATAVPSSATAIAFGATESVPTLIASSFTSRNDFTPAAVGTTLDFPIRQATFHASTAPVMAQATSHNTALMIVGGAGLLVGALVGDDAGAVIMVGGAVVGLIGLYRYLQ